MPVSLGRIARKALGPTLFPVAGRLYVRAFGNVSLIAKVAFDRIAADDHVLDVGGGDGAPLNELLTDRPNVTATMIDIATGIGGALEPTVRNRVRVLPHTSIAQFDAVEDDAPDIILIMDVMHHVPPSDRPHFFSDLAALVARVPVREIVIKDVEPDGSIRARMNYLADRYISNDRRTSPIGARAFERLLVDALGPHVKIKPTRLYEVHPPHYAFSVYLGDSK